MDLWATRGLIILVIFNIILTLVLFGVSWRRKARIEGFESREDINEALATLASVMNQGNMKVTNLEVTDGLTVGQKAKIGQMDLRGDRIGVSGRADLEFSPDKMVRHFDYDTSKHIDGRGFAANNVWAGQTATVGGVNLSKDKRGFFKIPSPLEVNNAVSGFQTNGPGLITNTVALTPGHAFTYGRPFWETAYNPAMTTIRNTKYLPVGSVLWGMPIGRKDADKRVEWEGSIYGIKKMGKTNGMYHPIRFDGKFNMMDGANWAN